MNAKGLIYADLKSAHGTVEQQKDAIFTTIESSFCDPDMWPLTDADRIKLLKELARRVLDLSRTEAAKKAASPAE